MSTAVKPRFARPRLRTVLLLVNLLVLALPLAGVVVLRVYESALVRQTETELVVQGAHVAAVFRDALNRQGELPADYGVAVERRWQPDEDATWRPRPPVLDISESSLVPAAPVPTFVRAPDVLAARAGASLGALLRDAQTTTLAGMRVLDMHGVVVASTGTDLGLSLAAREDVGRALRGEPVSVLRARELVGPAPPLSSISRGSRLQASVLTPVFENGRVVGAVLMSRTPSHLARVLYGKREEIAVAAVLLLLLAVGLALLTSTAIGRPMRGLIEQARRAAAGQRGAMEPLANPVTREVEQLSMHLASMARAMETRGEYIRTFAQHVSHEFKTPLTAIGGTVELLEEHGASMSDEERQRFLRNLRNDCTRLDALVRRLLELARADVAAPVDGESAPLHDALVEVQQHFHGDALNVSLAACTEPASVPMNAATLYSVFSSLVDNARQHGAHRIELACECEAGRCRVTLTDDGPGISTANAPRVFEPFFTTARDSGGTGLGLTVARALLAAHGGDIALRDSNAGCRIEVELPRVA